MQFPESWLREFCNPPLTTQELADTLTMGGLEVEELRPVAPPFTKIVVGEIKEAVQHPNADRLRVCQVDVGQGALLNIVCGAPNARVGIKVPCALVGAELPPGEDGKPFLIKLGKLRGVESQGMLCSARELKLSEDHGGLLELAADAPVGRGRARGAEARRHAASRSSSRPIWRMRLSVYGVARELSALTGAPLKQPEFAPVQPAHDAKLKVKVEAPDLCGRFSGRIVRNVDTKAKTPAVDGRSARALRPAQRHGAGRHLELRDVRVRPALAHLRLRQDPWRARQCAGASRASSSSCSTATRSRSTRTVGVIADDREVESLAGIMGGDATAVSDDTRNVYVEAAFWWPEAIQGRSRRFNFSTDAGHRFERGVDPSQTVEHIEHITRLIIEICGGEAGPDGRPDRCACRSASPSRLRVARAAKVIGMPLTRSAMRGRLAPPGPAGRAAAMAC